MRAVDNSKQKKNVKKIISEIFAHASEAPRSEAARYPAKFSEACSPALLSATPRLRRTRKLRRTPSPSPPTPAACCGGEGEGEEGHVSCIRTACVGKGSLPL